MNANQKAQKEEAARAAEGHTKSQEQQCAEALKRSMEDCP